jgi:glycerol-3-phosphate O-acyltransferase
MKRISAMEQDPITKMNAVSLISLATGRGRLYIEKLLKEMQAEGHIQFTKAPYSNAQLISRADIEKVIAAIKAES